MAITINGTASCTSCKARVEIDVRLACFTHSWNGVIGPGSSASQAWAATPALPDGWTHNFRGTFCSARCEDDYCESEGWGRPNQAKQEREQAEKVQRDRAIQALLDRCNKEP